MNQNTQQKAVKKWIKKSDYYEKPELKSNYKSVVLSENCSPQILIVNFRAGTYLHLPVGLGKTFNVQNNVQAKGCNCC